MDFLVHDDVLTDEGHLVAVGLEELLDVGRRLERSAEVDALGGVHQLDREDEVEIVHDFKQLCGCPF